MKKKSSHCSLWLGINHTEIHRSLCIDFSGVWIRLSTFWGVFRSCNELDETLNLWSVPVRIDRAAQVHKQF